MGEPISVLTEPRSHLLNQLYMHIAFGVLGIALLAFPGPYLTARAVQVRLLGVGLLAITTASPPIVRRLRHGGHRLEIYPYHFWFTSRLGDATVPWDTCGSFSVFPRDGNARRRRGRSFAGARFVDFHAFVIREPTPPWHRPRRRGGQRWERPVLSSRNGMSASHLALVMNHHRDSAAALREKEQAERGASHDAINPVSGPLPSRRRAGLPLRLVLVAALLAAGATAQVILIVRAHGGLNQPQANRCNSTLAAVRDINEHLLVALGAADTVPSNAAVTSDAAEIAAAQQGATGTRFAAIGRLYRDSLTLNQDLQVYVPGTPSPQFLTDESQFVADIQSFDAACDGSAAASAS